MQNAWERGHRVFVYIYTTTIWEANKNFAPVIVSMNIKGNASD
jgi:hypothetical protein